MQKVKFNPETCVVITPQKDKTEEYFHVELKNSKGRLLSHCFGNDVKVSRFSHRVAVHVWDGFRRTGIFFPNGVIFDGSGRGQA